MYSKDRNITNVSQKSPPRHLPTQSLSTCIFKNGILNHMTEDRPTVSGVKVIFRSRPRCTGQGQKDNHVEATL